MDTTDSKAFEDATGSWFIQGLDADKLAEIEAANDDTTPTRGGWAALMVKLGELLRR